MFARRCLSGFAAAVWNRGWAQCAKLRNRRLFRLSPTRATSL